MISFLMVTGCSDLKNNIPTASEKVSVHGPNFRNPGDTTFHGAVLSKSNYDFNACRVCHGANLDGVINGKSDDSKSCRKCHGPSKLHTSDVMNSSSPDFHGKFVAGNDWDFGACMRCHGDDYSGGKVGKTCKNCHNQVAGPEACNTCHGDFGDTTSWAPPRALDGSTATSSRGVGAHAAHLSNTQWSVAVKCEECHKVPTLFNDDGHIDFNEPIGRADLIFGSLSSKTTAATIPSPDYNDDSLSCASTYCHGTMKGGNSTNSPKWTDGPVKCGSCHGDGADNPAPLDASHNVFPLAIRMKCESCHSSSTVKTTLTGTTYTYTFTNKSKHLNGVVDR